MYTYSYKNSCGSLIGVCIRIRSTWFCGGEEKRDVRGCPQTLQLEEARGRRRDAKKKSAMDVRCQSAMHKNSCTGRAGRAQAVCRVPCAQYIATYGPTSIWRVSA